MNTNHPNITTRTTRSSVDYSAIPVREFYNSRIPIIPGSTVTPFLGVNRSSAATNSAVGVGVGNSNSVGSSYSGIPVVPVVNNQLVANSVPLSLVNPSSVQSNPVTFMSGNNSGSIFSGSGILPKKFSGTPTERVEGFLRSFNFYAKCHKWSDETKCEGVREFLEGKAKLWFDSMWRRGRDVRVDSEADQERKAGEVEKAAAKAKELLSNWSKLEGEMIKTFVSQDEKMMIRHALQNQHQQRNQKVFDYALIKQDLIDRLDPQMKEEEKLQYFLFGLTPQFQALVCPKKPKTLEEAIELATDYERGLDIAQGTITAVNYNVNTMNGVSSYNMFPDYNGMMNVSNINSMMYQPNGVNDYNNYNSVNLIGGNYSPATYPDMSMMPQLQYDVNAITNNRPNTNFHFRNNAANNNGAGGNCDTTT
jgi:hypothetical protein